MMEKEATIAMPVLTEYSPDANGRYGLLTCKNTQRECDLGANEDLMIHIKNTHTNIHVTLSISTSDN